MNDVSCVFPDVFAVFEHLTKEAGWSFGFHTAPQFEAMTLYDNRMAAAPFWHHPQASMKIWQMTHGSTALFPYDPMSEKVRNMRKYRIYSKNSLKSINPENHVKRQDN